MGRDVPDDYTGLHKHTGLRIEPHSVLAGEQVIAAYRNGRRVGVLYFKPQGLRLVFEESEAVTVEKRIGVNDFERVYENGGKR
jgi:hypothetical protein